MARNILECKDCGARYDVTRREPGSKVNCKRCRSVLKVPNKAKIKPSKKLKKEAAESKRAKKEVSKRLPTDENADPNDLRDGEMVQDLQAPFRENPVEAKAMVVSFANLLKHTLGRLVFGSVMVIFLGVVLTVIAIIITAVVFDMNNQGVKGRSINVLEGIISLLGVVAILVVQCMGMILGAKVLKGEDDFRDEKISGWKWNFLSALKGVKTSLKVFWKMLILESVFYGGMILLALLVYGVGQLPALLSQPLSVVNLVILIGAGTFLYLVTSIGMVGIIVEKRPIIFSLRRAGILIKSAIFPILKALVGFAMISSAFGFAFGLVGNFLFGNAVGTALASVLAKGFLGLFTTAVHFELTKDEGKG